MKKTFANLVNCQHTKHNVLRMYKESYTSVLRMGLYTVHLEVSNRSPAPFLGDGAVLFDLLLYLLDLLLLDYFFPASLPSGIHLL